MNLNSFLHAMRDSPDDLGQRLVFADWLEDEGDDLGAELVRLQCTAVPHAPWDIRDGTGCDSPRLDELVNPVAARWLGDVSGLEQVNVSFRRGMVRLFCSEHGLREHGDRVRRWLRSGWVESLALDLSASADMGLVPISDLSTVNQIAIWAGQRSELIEPLLDASRHVRQLKLHLTYWRGLADRLGALPRLEDFELRLTSWTPEQLPELLPVLARCRSLSLPGPILPIGGDPLGDTGLAMLLDALAPGRLEALDLCQCALTGEAISRLARCDRLTALRALNLNYNLTDDLAAMVLSESPPLTRLAHLGLKQNDLRPPGIRDLSESPLLDQLVTLDLSENMVRSDGAKFLADSPHLGRLKRLNVSQCHISESAARELLQSEHLTGLVEIQLHGNVIGSVHSHERMTLEQWRQLLDWPESLDPTPEQISELCAAGRKGFVTHRRRSVGILAGLWKRRVSLPVDVETVLVSALTDRDGQVRFAASGALSARAPGLATLPRLLALLDGTEPDDSERDDLVVPLRLIAVLGSDALSAEATLLDRAGGDQPSPPQFAVTLAAIGASSTHAVDAFRRWVNCHHPTVLQAAAQGLAQQRLDLSTVVDAWHRTASGDSTLTSGLRAALAVWPEAVERLLAFVTDGSPRVRGELAAVLALAKEPAGLILAALARLMDDSSRNVRVTAFRAVCAGEWRSSSLVAPLARCLDDEHMERAAVQALRVQGDSAADAVPALLRAGLAHGRHDPFLLCRDLGARTQPHSEAFRESLRIDDPRRLGMAEMALRQCAPQWPDAVAILSGWLTDSWTSVRDSAARVLEKLGESG